MKETIEEQKSEQFNRHFLNDEKKIGNSKIRNHGNSK